MTKISYDELERMLRDPSVPDAAIAPYLMADPEQGGPFDPRVVPDPRRVAMDATAEFRVESAMRWANAICRWRRQRRFEQRVAAGERLPVLVSEGDSWFQFPFLIEDVVDCLGADHLIWSLDAAGDTAQNMVRRNPEYLAGLRAHRDEVAAFLFSAAGNDVIGEDEFGEPVLKSLVKHFTAGKDAAWHIDQVRLAEVLLFLEGAYKEVMATVRAEFPHLPVLIHGYDHAIPGGHPGEWRSPEWAAVDQWLGRPVRRARHPRPGPAAGHHPHPDRRALRHAAPRRRRRCRDPHPRRRRARDPAPRGMGRRDPRHERWVREGGRAVPGEAAGSGGAGAGGVRGGCHSPCLRLASNDLSVVGAVLRSGRRRVSRSRGATGGVWLSPAAGRSPAAR